MAENLGIKTFRDRTCMPLITDDNKCAYIMSSGYCLHNNYEESNKDAYGALYNWFTVNTFKLYPAGWYASNDQEWQQLELCLGMNNKDIKNNN